MSDDGAILPAVAVALAVAVVVLRLQPKGPPEDGVRNAGTAWWWSPFAFSEDRYVIVNKNSIPAAVLDSGQNYAVDVPAGTTELDENAFHNYQRLIRRVHQNTPWADWFGLPAWGLFVGLTEITLPGELTHIGEQAFNGCSGLTEIAIPAGVTEIGMAAFCGCSGLTEIALPAGLREINFQVFRRCSGLATVTLPAGVSRIGDQGFNECSGLTEVTLPAGLVSIGAWAFNGCSGLTEITVPPSLTTLGFHAFDSSGLTQITLPAGLADIGLMAFAHCPKLAAVLITPDLTNRTLPVLQTDALRDLEAAGVALRWAPLGSPHHVSLSTMGGDVVEVTLEQGLVMAVPPTKDFDIGPELVPAAAASLNIHPDKIYVVNEKAILYHP